MSFFLRQLYEHRGWRKTGSQTLLDIGGANPKPCFSNDLFQPGDAIADVTNLSSFCFTPSDREALMWFPVDLDTGEWEQVEAHVALHGKFAFSVMLHTLEDLHNPRGALQKLSAVADAGVVVTPSKFAELLDFELVGFAGQGRLAKLGPWGQHSWRGFYHHRWIFAVKNGKLYSIPKTSIIDSDPELGKVTTAAARNAWGEMRVFWEGSLTMEVPMCHGFVATVQTYRQLLRNDDDDAERVAEASRAFKYYEIADWSNPNNGGYRGLESRVTRITGNKTSLCLCWEPSVSTSLFAVACDTCRSRWFLDVNGMLQDMTNPGWCVGGAAERVPFCNELHGC